jgi:hypothetical protein
VGLGLVSVSMRHLEMCCVALHCVVCTQLRHASFHFQFVVGYFLTWSLYFLSHCVLGGGFAVFSRFDIHSDVLMPFRDEMIVLMSRRFSFYVIPLAE